MLLADGDFTLHAHASRFSIGLGWIGLLCAALLRCYLCIMRYAVIALNERERGRPSLTRDYS